MQNYDIHRTFIALETITLILIICRNVILHEFCIFCEFGSDGSAPITGDRQGATKNSSVAVY